MAMEVYLYFNGEAQEAVDFYSKVFETEKNEIMTYGDMPPDPNMPIEEYAKKLIMNTYLDISGTTVMFSDIYEGMTSVNLRKGNNISLLISHESIEYITNLFNQLKAGGEVEMELQETFWSPLYGRLCDKFGIMWELYQMDYETDEKK